MDGRRRVARAYAALALLAVAVQFTLPDGLIRALAHLVVNGSGAAALWAGFASNRPRRRTPWILLGAALTVSVAGNLVYVTELLGAAYAVTWPLNRLLEVAAALLAVATAVAFLAARRPGQGIDGLLDTGIVLLIAVLLVVAGPAALLSPDRVVPGVLSVVMTAAVVVAVRMSVGATRPPISLQLLVLATALVLGGNLAVTLLGTDPGPPRAVDALWMLCAVAIGTAALDPSMVRVAEPETQLERRPTPRRLVLLGAGLLVNPALALVVSLRGTDHPLLIAVLLGLLTLLVLGRLGRLLLEREAISRELLHSQQRFRSLVQHAFDVIAVLDAQGALAYASPSIAALLGHPPEQCLGRPLAAFLHADDRAALQEALRAAAGEPEEQGRLEVRLRHADGHLRWGEVSLLDRLADPSVEGIVVNLRDVTERKRTQVHLERLARSDPLTGLPNRTGLLEDLQALLRADRHRREGFALLFLDLNGFKAVNDREGHAAGDRVLVAAAQRFRHALRPSDVLARFGGDEFVVLAPGVRHEQEARLVAERLHAATVAPFRWPELQVSVSCAIGVVIAGPRSLPPEQLIAAADGAMYRAKSGRVPTVIAEQPAPAQPIGST